MPVNLHSLTVFWLLLFVLIQPVFAANAVNPDAVIKIISSSDSKPYQQVTNSFKSSIKKARSTIRFTGQEEDNDQLTGSIAMVFALGSQAVQKALQENKNQNLLATIIVSDQDLRKAAHATAILLSNPIQKQLQWHQRILPESKRIGVLYDPGVNQQWVDRAAKIASTMGLEIIAVPVISAKELPSALKLLGRKADSILGILDKTVYSSKTAKSVLLFSFRNKIPFVGLSSAWVKAGALYALDWDYPALGAQSASIALQILAGKKASEISPQFPQQTRYLLNLKTAKHMKLKLSQQLIDGASGVFE